MVAWGQGACGVRMLVGVCAVFVVVMRVVLVSCVVHGAWAEGGGPAPDGRPLRRVSGLVEQEFGEVGLVCWG